MSWTRKWAASGHSAPVYNCSADDKFVYSSSGDRYVTRWSIKDGSQDAFAIKLDSPAYITGTTVNENMLIIGCSNGTVVAIDRSAKQLLWEHNFRGNALFSFCDCPEWGFFLLGDSEGQLLVINYAGRLVAGFPLGCGKIRQIKPSGDSVFIACQDSTIRRIELPSFNEIQRFNAGKESVNALLGFPGSQLIVSGGKDAHLHVWDAVTEQEQQSVPAHYQTIYGAEPLDADSFVTVSMDKTIKIWDTHAMKVMQRIEHKHGGHSRSVNGCVRIAGDAFVTFGDDKQVIFWQKEDRYS